MGIGFEIQKNEEIPTEETDQNLDAIITEEKIYINEIYQKKIPF